MAAYVIVGVDVLDEEAAWAYAAVAQPSVLSYGGRYLVAGPTAEPVEGGWDFARLVVIEFPTMARIREWYDSAEYRRAREIRADAIRVQLSFFEGVPPEGSPLPA